MPVLTFDDTSKRFIVPSTEQKPEQGWVEMMTYPLCADDFAAYYSKLYNPVEGAKPPVLNFEILARRLTAWNYTDSQGAALPITAETIGHLPPADVTFLVNRIEDEVVPEPQEAGEQEKKDATSSAISSQPPTVNP